MASKQANKRLMKEHADLQKAPPPYIIARPKETDILEWHYIIRGPPDTPYDGGEYWGTVVFPPDYPFKPPGIKMITPSGRFQPDRKICTSMSDYHPGSWNPAWSVNTILTGLLSFMVSDEITTGSVRSTEADRRIFAKRSHAYNVTQARFKSIFPDHLETDAKDLPNMGDPRSSTPLPPTDPAAAVAPSTVSSTIGTGTAAAAHAAALAPPPGQSSSRAYLKAFLAAVGVWVVLSWFLS